MPRYHRYHGFKNGLCLCLPRPATVAILHMASTFTTFTGPSRKGGAAQVHGDLRGMQAGRTIIAAPCWLCRCDYWFLSCFYKQNFVQKQVGDSSEQKNHPLLKNFWFQAPPKMNGHRHQPFKSGPISPVVVMPGSNCQRTWLQTLRKRWGRFSSLRVLKRWRRFWMMGYWKCMEMHGLDASIETTQNKNWNFMLITYCMSFRTYFIDFLRRS